MDGASAIKIRRECWCNVLDIKVFEGRLPIKLMNFFQCEAMAPFLSN
jgi:hypothetical protein